jgi:polyphosphate kinase
VHQEIVPSHQPQETDSSGYVLLEPIPRATQPHAVPKDTPIGSPRLLFNRELSWLDFNWRVLHQARDKRVPLLERVRFVSIAASNLDEFFRKRMGGLKRQLAAGVQTPSPDGRTPAEQLRMSREAVLEMARALSSTWEQDLKPALATQAGIRVRPWVECTPAQQAWLRDYFMTHVFPVLTPLAVDPGHPFPFISNLSLSLAVMLKHPTRKTEHFARLKVPTSEGRWIPLRDGGGWVPLEDVIAANAEELFRGMKVSGVYPFRITRNADLKRDEEVADDLIEMIAEELQERRFAPIVRLQVNSSMPDEVREILSRELTLQPDDLYEVDGDLDLVSVSQFANLDRPELRYTPWNPVTPKRLLHEGEAKDCLNIFQIIKRGDLLVHHPYESFATTVLRLLEEAAVDPDVLAIKQTLYRTSDESPVVKALLKAADHGKQVAVLIEVKARFDEQNNIEWGQKLEQHGVHVTYGLVGLKTHCKTTLVVRKEGAGLRTYSHIGTGNYHPSTAKLYTDLGLFTRSRRIGDDLVNLFHYLTGYAPEQHYSKLIVAPREMRRFFVEQIRQEIANQEAHGNGRILAKMNALDDLVIIDELYKASQAGVQIDLIVRGHCRLRPGLPGYSDNIRVVSIIGRFLEHSRIYCFGNNGDPRYLIGSADWQRRNLDDRVEVLVEVKKREIRSRLQRIMDYCLADRSAAWELDAEGIYRLRSRPELDRIYGTHELFMDRAMRRRINSESPWDL